MLVSNSSKNDKTNAGLVFISEKSNMENRDISSLDVTNKNGVFYVSFDTVLHSFGVMNRNHRMYTADNVWRSIVESEKIQALLADNAWYGEMNHPTQYYDSMKLTPERLQDPAMHNRSHKILRPKLVGNLLQAHIETASGTECGVGFAKEIIQGLKPAFSCRAVATMNMQNGKPVVEIRRMITYDWVLYPSHKEAHIISEPKLINKMVNVYQESVNENTYIPDFIMPLKDILRDTAENDPNTNTILESFNLSYDDLMGYDRKHNNVIIRDGDNKIYANINPSTKKKVDNFFASFM